MGKRIQILTTASAIILTIGMIWSCWTAATTFTSANVTQQEIQEAIEQQMQTMPSYMLGLTALFGMLIIPSIIMVLIWTFRASANLKELRVLGQRYTPLLSVVFSCLPIVGFLMNALIMQELYRISTSPDEWYRTKPSTAIRFYLFFSSCLTCLQLFPLSEEYLTESFYINAILLTISAILWMMSMLQICKKQQALMQNNNEPPTDNK